MSFPNYSADKSAENYAYECAGYDVAYKDTYFDIWRTDAYKKHLPKNYEFIKELTDGTSDKHPVDWGKDTARNQILYLAGFNNGQMDGGEWGSMHKTAEFQNKALALIEENVKWTKIGAIACICSCIIQMASTAIQFGTFMQVKSIAANISQLGKGLNDISSSIDNASLRRFFGKGELDPEEVANPKGMLSGRRYTTEELRNMLDDGGTINAS